MSFQCAVVHCVSKGGQLPGTRLLIWLLQKEHKLLDMLLNPQLSSIEDAIKVAKLMKTIVDQLDVLLARALKEVPRSWRCASCACWRKSPTATARCHC